MTSHDIHTLAGAYVLHALPGDEERFFESHLQACEPCRHEVAELRATAAAMAAGVSEPAPASLRASVLSAIDVTRQEPAPGVGTQTPWLQRRLPALSVAAAFILLVAGFGFVTAQLRNSVDQERQLAAQVAAILTAEDARTIPVTGGDHGHLVASSAHSTTVFVGRQLPDVDAGKTLEMWLIDEDGAEPAGLFRPDEEGRALVVVPHDLSGVDAVGVTVEPAQGSPQPTTDPILLAEV